jgi:hypothetical protein
MLIYLFADIEVAVAIIAGLCPWLHACQSDCTLSAFVEW